MASFQVSEQTSRLLKNFAGISNSLLLAEGTTQKTLAPSKAVLALAELPEAWPQETGIFDLSLFLSTLSLFDTPGIEFDTESMAIKAGRSQVRYRYSDPSTILTPPTKVLKTDNPKVEFALPDNEFAKLKKSANLLELEAVEIRIEKGAVTLVAKDPKNAAGHTYQYDVPDEAVTRNDSKFATSLVLKTEHLSMLLDGGYTVAVSDWSYAYFTHKTEPIRYFVVQQS